MKTVNFRLVDVENWSRKEYYNHYINNVVCTYSITQSLDISKLKGEKLYPAMLWLLTAVVNEMEEFRTSLSPQGLGIFDEMHPSYTIFNRENKNFSVIWTENSKDYRVFLQRYEQDVEKYSHSTALAPKENKPVNTFDVSMIPWTTFTAFNLNIYGDGNYLLPIFTMGKATEDGGKTTMPIGIQVHHSVCDGYHVSMFLQRLQEKIDGFDE